MGVGFADVQREEVWMGRCGCMCVGRGNIGLRLGGEAEGHMRTCGCPSGGGTGKHGGV